MFAMLSEAEAIFIKATPTERSWALCSAPACNFILSLSDAHVAKPPTRDMIFAVYIRRTVRRSPLNKKLHISA
jgi:hypothetical protein